MTNAVYEMETVDFLANLDRVTNLLNEIADRNAAVFAVTASIEANFGLMNTRDGDE